MEKIQSFLVGLLYLLTVACQQRDLIIQPPRTKGEKKEKLMQNKKKYCFPDTFRLAVFELFINKSTKLIDAGCLYVPFDVATNLHIVVFDDDRTRFNFLVSGNGVVDIIRLYSSSECLNGRKR